MATKKTIVPDVPTIPAGLLTALMPGNQGQRGGAYFITPRVLNVDRVVDDNHVLSPTIWDALSPGAQKLFACVVQKVQAQQDAGMPGPEFFGSTAWEFCGSHDDLAAHLGLTTDELRAAWHELDCLYVTRGKRSRQREELLFAIAERPHTRAQWRFVLRPVALVYAFPDRVIPLDVRPAGGWPDLPSRGGK